MPRYELSVAEIISFFGLLDASVIAGFDVFTLNRPDLLSNSLLKSAGNFLAFFPIQEPLTWFNILERSLETSCSAHSS